ncbi:MAG: glycosyltransferase family 39 protein, partial [Gloeobacteraceae cyanobacterium ES-bin-316]|nr:glycosyltransferase family 39 protein [Ferruginibacter sp.]
MKQFFLQKHILILLAAFAISRILLMFFNINMDYDSINVYWQYLSMESLQHNLLKGVWYNHTQPPIFNLFLGLIVKLSGSYAGFVFSVVFKVITIVNVILLYNSSKILVGSSRIPLVLSLIYLLSPATMILENELFYTTFITMLLLISCNCLLRFTKTHSLKYVWGFFLSLSVVCLTRSMYNIMWLVVIAIAVIFYFRKTAPAQLVVIASCCILLTSSWYIKNYFIFGKFTTSTWLGMNLARNVFHDFTQLDSSKIESIEPFSKISSYQPFLSGSLEKKYAGLNDIELLNEFKNGGHINENHINYIEVSEKYGEVSKKYIVRNPVSYFKNVLQSCVIFFVPATHYPYAINQAKKIWWYDVAYSFNLS